VLSNDGDGGDAIYLVLLRAIGLEDEVHFLDRDVAREDRQLVEDLLRLQARLAAERLREEQQTDRAQHLAKGRLQTLLIRRRYQRHLDIEQIVERLLGAVGGGTLLRRRARLPLDGRPRREQLAEVDVVFRRDAGGQRGLAALEPGAGVERRALDAAVERRAALRTLAVRLDRQRKQQAAARAAEDLVRAHQVRRLRTSFALQLASGRARLRRLGGRFLPRLTIARVVLIAALPVLPVAHRDVILSHHFPNFPRRRVRVCRVVDGRPEGLHYICSNHLCSDASRDFARPAG